MGKEKTVIDREEEMKKDDASVRAMADFTSPEVLYDELITAVKKYHPSANISMIEKAYRIPYDPHKDQVRKSGAP